MHASTLSVHGITKQFGAEKNAHEVLSGISMTFKQGESYAITGVSGTGKSTLMHLLVGIDSPTSGAVFFNDQELVSMDAKTYTFFLQAQVGLLFQQPYLIKELSVGENVMLPGLIAGRDLHVCAQKADLLLKEVGLAHKAASKPASLSGGQQQRVALARALLNEPAFLIADEPTGNLDERTAADIVALLVRLQAAWHMGIIISTHDLSVANQMRHQYRLHEGRIEKL